jgi:hypothetical protein
VLNEVGFSRIGSAPNQLTFALLNRRPETPHFLFTTDYKIR